MRLPAVREKTADISSQAARLSSIHYAAERFSRAKMLMTLRMRISRKALESSLSLLVCAMGRRSISVSA